MGALIAIRLMPKEEGFLTTLYASSTVTFLRDWIVSLPGSWPQNLKFLYDFSWLTAPGYSQYLYIMIPATFIGEYLLEWMRSEDHQHQGNWGKSRSLLLTVIMICLNILVVCYLFRREDGDILFSLIASVILSIIAMKLSVNPGNSTEKYVSRTIGWGLGLLVLGYLFEPYEGGIKKDPSTLSYFFVTSGLAVFLLNALMILIEKFKVRSGIRLLVDNGQNPMIAYCCGSFLLTPFLNLSGLVSVLDQFSTGWTGFLKGALCTLVIALIVKGFTKMKIYLRT